MSIGVLIQARSGSSRLPEKIMLPFYRDKCVLELLLARLKYVLPGIPVVVATTESQSDDVLVNMCKSNGAEFFRGSENNVLDRFISAATHFGFTKIVRICSDNPFLDEKALKILAESLPCSNVDYWGYAKSDNTPVVKTHWGFWCEGVSLRALKAISHATKDALYLEHVTNYIYTFPRNFKIHFQHIPIEVERNVNIRLTLDTKEDFSVQSEIYSDLIENKIPFDSVKIVKYVENNKLWLTKMNQIIDCNPK